MNPRDIRYTIADAVFDQFPGYVRGVVVAYDVQNGRTPAELVATMRDEEAAARERLALDRLAKHPRIAAWREAFRVFGAKPTKYRPSVEGMARRVLRDRPLPTINTLVDIGNVVSLRHLAPAGGHAIDVVTRDLALRPATGQETFVPFGSEEIERPEPGEIIFAEGDTVLTRRWTWRQANHTLTLPTTTAIEFNVDGLPPMPQTEVEEACQEIIELVATFCGGRIRYEILTRDHPTIQLFPEG